MRCAIGVMARAPVPGRCKTRLIGARDAAWVARLYAAMLEDTLGGFEALGGGRKIVFVAPTEGADALALVRPHVGPEWELVLQEGADLGARIEHAFGCLFRDAPAVAIVSGSDAPTLPVHALSTAPDADVVLAPCADGGYGLVGLRRAAPELFRGIPWSTADVLDATRARARSLALSVHELPLSFDVDEPEDLVRLSADLARDPIRAPKTARVLRASW